MGHATSPATTWKAPIELPSGLAPIEPPADFAARAEAIGVSFEAGEVEQLGRYLALLLAANEAMNLTAVRDPAEAWERHLLDSLTLLPVLAEAGDALSVLDVGSGGGLPGLPLAICTPGSRFTLMDATAKKCAFLDHAVSELGLANVTVVDARAEEAGRDRLRGAFDVVTARAVGRLATLLELTVPFAKVGGLCVLTKGQKAEEELAEAKRAMHLLHATHAGTIETPTGRIVVVEKRRETPRAYPRAVGEPKRRPLGKDAEGDR